MTTSIVYAPCPRCKAVHEVDTKTTMQTCPICETRWPRERNGK